MIKKKKAGQNLKKGKTTTTTRMPRKITTINPSRLAKLQKRIRQTAVPNLRKLTADQVSSTTGIWDKLTGLPFYSTTAEWATPTKKKSKKSTQGRYALIKEGSKEEDDDDEEEDDSSADEELYSLEAGDESADESATTQPYYTKPRPKTSSASTRTSVDLSQISSPGPDASENEIRRYWWKMKQWKRGNTGDYWALNKVTIAHCYPIPMID
jgi:hypothetical protein